MMPIFADAWQTLQGRTGANKLTGQKALDELLKATEKRQVIAAKILPLVEQIARERASEGIDKMRTSSEGQRSFFMNQLSEGWQKFADSGGEVGLQRFWQSLQRIGGWFKDNADTFGVYFDDLAHIFDFTLLAVKESWQFLVDGTKTSIIEMIEENIGVDLSGIRNTVVKVLEEFKGVFTQVTQITGFEKNGSLMEGLKDKIATFVINLNSIMASVSSMLQNISVALDSFRKYKALTVSEQIAGFIPGTESNKLLTNSIMSTAGAVGDVVGATYGAGVAVKDIVYGSKDRPVPQPMSTYDKNIAQIPSAWPATSPQGIAEARTKEKIIQQQSKMELNVNITGDGAMLLDTPAGRAAITKQVEDTVGMMVTRDLSAAPDW